MAVYRDILVEEESVCIGAAVLIYLHVHKLGFPSCLSENTVIVLISVWCNELFAF